MDAPERLLKTNELAERLGVSDVTLKKWRLAGFGPPWKRLRGPRGEIRYLESSAVKWMKEDLNGSYAEELARRPQNAPQEAPDSPQSNEGSKGYDSRTGRFVTRDEW